MADVAPSPPSTAPHAASPSVARSASDVLRLAVAAALLLVLLLLQWLAGDALIAFAEELLRGLDALPDWIVDVVFIATRVLGAVVLVGGLVIAFRGGGLRMLGTAGVAALVAAGLVALLEQFDPGDGSTALDVGTPVGPLLPAGFPSDVGLAAITAALTAGAPWFSRRARRIGWALTVGLSITHFVATPTSFDTLRALLCGWVAGAVALVVLGGPTRRPTTATVTKGLEAVGLRLASLEQASVDARGSTPYFGVAVSGEPLFVKALGEDERSADLLFRFYRMLARRDRGDERPFSSLRRAVEHEAMVALAARDVGIRTPRLVAFATAEPNAFVLAYEAVKGRSLDRVEAGEVTDEILAAIWDQVGELRRRRIAHRDLRLANMFLAADGAVWLIDFGFSELAASDLLLATDVAELISSLSLKVGPERAVAQGQAALTPEEIAPAVDRLRLWALSGATRTGLKESPGLLEDIRARVSAAAGV